MGDTAGLEEMHNNCGEVMYTGTMNRGFTILSVVPNRVQPLYSGNVIGYVKVPNLWLILGFQK